MHLRHATFLRIVAGWTVFVWAVLIKNMLGDSNHSIAFRAVHIGLAVISIALAAGTFVVVRIERGRR
ncbi:MAG: hypothetical protein QOJ00_809 [Actinomycetota bacterium]